MRESEYNPIHVIVDQLGEKQLLLQLAEELNEFAHAALKLYRAIDGSNPTPRSEAECKDAMLEELADVSVCLTVLGYNTPLNRSRMATIYGEKIRRWAERLENKK